MKQIKLAVVLKIWTFKTINFDQNKNVNILRNRTVQSDFICSKNFACVYNATW